MPAGISSSDFYYILPELVLTVGALLVLIADVALPKSQRAALAWVALLALGATAVSLVPFTSTRVEVAQGLMAVDQFALFFKAVFLFAAAITVLMSVRYLAVEGASPGEYYFAKEGPNAGRRSYVVWSDGLGTPIDGRPLPA